MCLYIYLSLSPSVSLSVSSPHISSSVCLSVPVSRHGSKSEDVAVFSFFSLSLSYPLRHPFKNFVLLIRQQEIFSVACLSCMWERYALCTCCTDYRPTAPHDCRALLRCLMNVCACVRVWCMCVRPCACVCLCCYTCEGQMSPQVYIGRRNV